MKNYTENEIEKSIYTYQSVILLDPNMRIKLIDENTTYGVKLANWQENNLLLELRQTNINLNLSKKHTINMLTSHSTFVANVSIVKKIPQDKSTFYMAQIISPIHQKRQRNHFRQEATVPVTLIVIAEKNSKVKPPPPIKGITIDISAGGLKFTSITKIAPPLNVYINFSFHNLRLTLKGRILEHFEEVDTHQFIYRVAFKDIDTETQQKLEKNILEYGSSRRYK